MQSYQTSDKKSVSISIRIHGSLGWKPYLTIEILTRKRVSAIWLECGPFKSPKMEYYPIFKIVSEAFLNANNSIAV
jgi:hypothetical protein